MRGNEIHLGSFSDLKLSNENIGEVKRDKIFKEKNISEFKLADNSSTRAFVVQVFEPKEFNVCPQCRKKIVLEGEQYICAEHGKVSPEKRSLMNVVIDDGTETIKAVMFHDVLQGFSYNKEDILGKEMIFSGDVRLNKFFNNPEFIIEKAEEPNLDEILKKLESI
jgi:RecG-like helicase